MQKETEKEEKEARLHKFSDGGRHLDWESSVFLLRTKLLFCSIMLPEHYMYNTIPTGTSRMERLSYIYFFGNV